MRNAKCIHWEPTLPDDTWDMRPDCCLGNLVQTYTNENRQLIMRPVRKTLKFCFLNCPEKYADEKWMRLHGK